MLSLLSTSTVPTTAALWVHPDHPKPLDNVRRGLESALDGSDMEGWCGDEPLITSEDFLGGPVVRAGQEPLAPSD
jgi:hypothetical protein